MLTEERIIELQKLNATIYEARYGRVHPIKLNENMEVYNYGCVRDFNKDALHDRYYFQNLYETKEEAEFILNCHSKRVEKLEPPLYNKIKSKKNFEVRFVVYDKEFEDLVEYLCCFEKGNIVILFRELNKNSNNIDMAYDLIYEEKDDEQNYIKAMAVMKKFFDGDECYEI